MPFDRLATTYRQLGWLDGSLYLLAATLERLTRGRARVHKYCFVAQAVGEARLAGRRGSAIEVREIGPADPLLSEFPRPPQVMPYRFSQGAVCLAAFKHGQCAGFLWMVLGPYAEDEVRCRYVPLPEGEACWDFDLYVYPEHRGGLVFARLWDEANRYLAARNVRWSLSRISAFNAGSLQSHRRMGAKPLGSAIFFCAGSWQVFAGTMAPYVRVSRRPDAFPTLALHA